MYTLVGSTQALSGPSIAEVVQATSMSNDAIENLIDQLLDKMDTNAEVSASFLSLFVILIHQKYTESLVYLYLHFRLYMYVYVLCFCRPRREERVLKVSRKLTATIHNVKIHRPIPITLTKVLNIFSLSTHAF